MQSLQLLRPRRPRRPHHMRRQTTKIAHQLPSSPADTAHSRQNHHETVQNCHPSIDDLQQYTGDRAKSAPEKNSRVPRPLARLTFPRSPEIIAARTRTESNKPEQSERGRSVPIANQQPRSPGAVSPRIAILQVRPPLDTQLHARPGPDTTAQLRTPPNMTEHCRTRPTGVGQPIRPLTPALATSNAQTDAERRSSRRPCRRTGYPAVPQPHHHHLRSTARLARSRASPAR